VNPAFKENAPVSKFGLQKKLGFKILFYGIFSQKIAYL